MNSNREQETIRLYLLGQASPEDSSWAEEKLLADGDFFQELLIAEDELIDQYVRDGLTSTDRESFRTHFLLAPERRQKLQFGRALRKYVNTVGTSEPLEDDAAENVSDEKPDAAKPPPKKRGVFSFLPFSNPIVSYSFAAAILLIAIGVSWVVFNNWNKQKQQPENVYVATLTPGLTRDSGEWKRVTIQGSTDGVELQLTLPIGEYQKYKVELQTSESRTIYTEENLAAEFRDGNRRVVFTVSAALLPVGDYQVGLSGINNAGQLEPVGKYFFRVVRP